jgi:hypothetical protein
MLTWFVRRSWWDFIAWFKFAAARPLYVKAPPKKRHRIEPEPMIEAIPEVPLREVMVCPYAAIPRDERELTHSLFYRFQVWLYTAFSPMQPGLPRIDPDPQVALKRAFKGLRRRQFAAPLLPAEYLGLPDLGSLAVRGPFACYTTRCAEDDGTWEWNFDFLDKYEHHPGLRKIDSHVWFLKDRSRLRAYRIRCDLGDFTPTDPLWEQACKIALCAASTHISLVRHFNWVHLAGGAQLAIATRNSLSSKHPLCRLLWPFIYGTQQSNDMVTRGQMVRGGDFETTFSLTFKGMCDLFDDSYRDYQHTINDPERDGDSRGIRGVGLATPTQQNLEDLFKVMHSFALNYLDSYYPPNANGADDLCRDPETLAWLDELNSRLPNGVGVDSRNFTRDELARMLAGQIFLVSVQHELLGGSMWNYQLWTHRQPARIYPDFEREPLDVYQRLVNANFNLNVHRRALMDDFAYLACDDRGRAAMLRFRSELTALQAKMDGQPDAVWRVHPRNLKVNINA